MLHRVRLDTELFYVITVPDMGTIIVAPRLANSTNKSVFPCNKGEKTLCN